MKKITSAMLIGVSALTLSACSFSQSGSTSEKIEGGSLSQKADLNAVKVTVAGKEFTEQQILCEMTAQALESVKAEVTRQCGMNGSATVRSALTSGAVDMYWEYTGTGWITHLKETETINDPTKLWETLDKEDQEKNKITWLQPTPANNTYAIAIATEQAEKFGVKSVSDYAKLAKENPSQATFCGAAEFFSRNDGWPGVQKNYGFELPKENTSELAAGAVYNAIDKQNPCNFGEVFATDGRIQALNLTVLDDDKQFFTPYNPSLSIRSEVLDKNPAIAEVFKPISEALTNDVLQKLNAEVDVDGRTASDVANSWLKAQGFIG